MTNSHLLIPVEPWAPAQHVSASVRSALDLYQDLEEPTNVLRLLSTLTYSPLPLSPDKATATTSVAFSTDEDSITVRLTVAAELRCSLLGRLATIEAIAASRWRISDGILEDGDPVLVFVHALSLVEPASVAEKAVQSALNALGVDLQVVVSESVWQNTRECARVALESEMDSDHASPLNPFALIGVAGWEAMQWEDHGISAAEAEPWVKAHFKPATAAEWIDHEFVAELASLWHEVGVAPAIAAELAGANYLPRHLAEAASYGIDLDVLMTLAGTVEIDEMPDWLNAIADHEMMNLDDVWYLVRSGITSDRLGYLPEGLTAGEAVRYLSGDGEVVDYFEESDLEGQIYGDEYSDDSSDEDDDDDDLADE